MSAETVSLISDIVVGISALGVAVIAFFGLRTWRRELTGKAKFTIARDLMLLGFKIKSNFEDARYLFTYSPEFANRVRKEGEMPNVSQVLDEWYARSDRMKPLYVDLVKMVEVSWEAQILLDKNSSNRISEALATYRERDAELTSAIHSYFDTRKLEETSGQPYKDQDWLEKLHRTIYALPEDDFSKQIDEATNKLESALQAYVK